MHDSRKQFHYSLDSLLGKRHFDLAVLKIEEAHAQQAFSEKVRELDALVKRVIHLEDEIRRVQSGETPIIPDRLNSMMLFLKHQRENVEQKVKERQQVELVHQQITQQIRTLKQSIKSLEKNKASKQQQYATLQRRAGFIEMDNLWLARKQNSQA